ncbi:MAG TPA: uroporphyrinogen decarboxylase family protein [Phototrophicaceae bacterium]|nr:uroporphyrinogen decarboxylase family protein [Phototrophicaceae bacterium]
MNKRERLAKAIAGEPTDRVPVALWRHWPGDDQRAADLARSVVDFQKAYDWDLVKVTPASSYMIADYGVQDVWEGNLEGTRTYTKRAVNRSLDWTELRPLDPTRGSLGKQIECLNLVGDALKDDDAPILATIFSPLAQGKNIAGKETLVRHLRTNPDRVHTGLNVLTETTLRLIEALKRTAIAGIFYAVQHASYDVMSEDEYKTFGLPYDQKILETLPSKWWLNMLHLHGEAPMFRLCSQLPVQAINWHDQESEPDLAQGKSQFNNAVCGGLSRWQHVHHGTPNSIREQVRAAIQQTNGRRFILSTGCVSMITSPLSNLRAVREAVEG